MFAADQLGAERSGGSAHSIMDRGHLTGLRSGQAKLPRERKNMARTGIAVEFRRLRQPIPSPFRSEAMSFSDTALIRRVSWPAYALAFCSAAGIGAATPITTAVTIKIKTTRMFM